MVNNENDKWIRPWNIEKFDDLYNRDERFFSVLMKGFLGWMNQNVLMYDKPIRHFIQNTGSSYLYVENNGYSFSMNETSGEDMIYMEMPRCIVTLGGITIPFEELTQPYARGNYERRSGNEIKGYNAVLRRIPVEWDITLKYILSNFNEAIVLIQELIDKLAFQQYFNITYLGQVIECAFEIPSDFTIELNRIDMTAPDPNQKTIDIAFKITTNYPSIDEKTEISTGCVISNFEINTNVLKKNDNNQNTTKHITLNTNNTNDKLQDIEPFSVVDKNNFSTVKHLITPVTREQSDYVLKLSIQPVKGIDNYDNLGDLISTKKYNVENVLVGETIYDKNGDVNSELIYIEEEIITLSKEEYEKLHLDINLGFKLTGTYNEKYKYGTILIDGTHSFKIL